jgi:SAM-dependent methyltransferase
MPVALELDRQELRKAVQDEYTEVATCPMNGFHFHTGRRLAHLLGYPVAEVEALPDRVVESFAGVGNPFAWGGLRPGEAVVEVGSGAGLDSILAAGQVGPAGRVIGVDMTEAMLAKARHNTASVGAANVEFRRGYAEELPVPAGIADVVISNGVINLCPDKLAAWREIFRVLKPGGRFQIADIVVAREVPESAQRDISLWTS